MKKHIYSLFAAALLVFCAGCSNDDDGPAISDKGVVGEWHLTSWNHETPADFDVYVQFGADGKFDIFQKVETSAYVRYSGRFAASDSRLSGRYSDGVAWSTDYTFELSDNGDTLTMTSATEGAEVSVYTRTPIPEEDSSGVRLFFEKCGRKPTGEQVRKKRTPESGENTLRKAPKKQEKQTLREAHSARKARKRPRGTGSGSGYSSSPSS